jgi:hypothetical protein
MHVRAAAGLGSVVVALLSAPAHCQVTPEQAAQIRDAIGNRIEALTILGGDYGIAGASFRSTGKFSFGETTDATVGVTKLGGAGEIGDPRPVGGLSVGWQPRVQGNMGYLEGTQRLHSPLLEGDSTRIAAYGIEFGGGARFWVNDRLSVAPTVMGLLGRMSNTYTANSAFMRANLDKATELGLVNWNVDTFTLITPVNIQYVFTWDRTIITLSSEPIYYHTESFNSSNAHLQVNGDSGSLENKVDVDVPLGLQLYGHELRAGGYLERTDLFGSLESGLNEPYIYEVHGRVVLDFLTQLWKVQWMGIGASYLWGPSITGWSVGADVVFRF